MGENRPSNPRRQAPLPGTVHAWKPLAAKQPALAFRLCNLAELYRQDGRYGKAEPLYRRTLAILEKEQPAQSPALAHSLKTFADMLRRMKRKPEAVALEARANIAARIGKRSPRKAARRPAGEWQAKPVLGAARSQAFQPYISHRVQLHCQ